MRSVPTRLLLACGVAGPILLVAGFLLLGAVRRDYDPMRQFVSLLALTAEGWTMTALFIASGVLVIAATIGLRRALPSGPGSRWIPITVGLAGLGLILAGIFPTDPVQGYPPGAPTVMPATASPTAAVHLVAALLIFLFLPVAAFVASRRLRADGRTLAAAASLAGGIVMITANAVTSAAPGTAGLVPDIAGLLQRISLIAGFAWLAWFSADLFGTSARPVPVAVARPADR
jgi:hypothetical membrane protein